MSDILNLWTSCEIIHFASKIRHLYFKMSYVCVWASVAGHKSWSLQCLINELGSGRNFFSDFTAVCVLVSLLLLKRLFPSPDGPEITLTMGSFSVFCFPFCGFFLSQKLDGSQEVVAWKTGSSEPLVDASSRTGSDVPLRLSRENIMLDLLVGDLFKYAGLCLFVLGPVHLLFPLVVIIINVIKQEGLSCDEMIYLQLTGWHLLFISNLALKLLK